MKGFFGPIERDTLANNDFRHVLYTSEHLQLVLMTLPPQQEIGWETHQENDQFFRFEAGQGKVIIDDHEYEVGDGDAIIVPAGARHNVINLSATKSLKLYTIYAPPHHRDGVIRATKQEALADEPEFDGQTTE